MRKISKVEEELVPSQSVAQESVAHLQAENEELREKLNQKEKKCKEFEVQVLLLKTKEEDASKEAKELRANLREARANSAFLAKQLEETKLQLENATLHAARMLSEEEIKKAIRTVYNGETYFSAEVNETVMQNMLKGGVKRNHKLVVDLPLTTREIEVLRLILKEFTNQEIADERCHLHVHDAA